MQPTTGLMRQLGAALAVSIALALSGTPASAEQLDPSGSLPNVEYTLLTGFHEGNRAFIGVGREIDGRVNPKLHAKTGNIIQLIIINGDGADHEFVVAGLGAKTAKFAGEGAAEVVTFRASESGIYKYSCMNNGHRKHGMEGLLVVSDRQ